VNWLLRPFEDGWDKLMYPTEAIIGVLPFSTWYKYNCCPSLGFLFGEINMMWIKKTYPWWRHRWLLQWDYCLSANQIIHESMTADSGLVWFMVLNTTCINISAISWRSVLLVEETGVPRENHRPVASCLQTLSHNVVSSTRSYKKIIFAIPNY
jgi:hypothetical protein